MKQSLFILAAILILTSCEKFDLRDDYVGSWNVNVAGNLKMYYGSELIGTIPVDYDNSMRIEKTPGTEFGLSIDDLECTMMDGKLVFEPQTETQSEDGLTMQLTINRTGTFSTGLIVIKETYTGNWNKQGEGGILSGTSTITLTKK